MDRNRILDTQNDLIDYIIESGRTESPHIATAIANQAIDTLAILHILAECPATRPILRELLQLALKEVPDHK